MFNRQLIHVALLLWGGIFSLIAALCMYMSRNFDRERRKWLLLVQISSAVLLFSDAFAWEYRGGTGEEAAVIVKISNFLVFSVSDIVLCFFHGYICSYLFPKKKERKKDRRVAAGYLIALFGVLMVIVSQFTHLYYQIDAQNYYHRNPGYVVSLLIPMSGMLLELSLLVQYQKKLQKEVFYSMMSYLLLPLLGAVLLFFYYGISFVNIAVSISVVFMFLAAMAEQNQNLAKKEKEAADMRIAIMISQIQPHFMYNSLNTIYHLCDKDTAQAKEAVSDFSEYLQHILHSVNCAVPIPFAEELQHVKSYLNLEKMRFEEELQIVYDMETVDFKVPALSIQPLVENAVKHGICKKEGGGTVRLATRTTENGIIVTISDDGTGFSPGQIPADGKPHLGIQNVTERIQAMCGGTLTIESESGRGTTVTVKIPKENSKRYENIGN